ncbi:MAG: immunity protein 19 [Acetatifactor sp.]|nr:immunity protein 19 [Acetatifactor sp.]
MRKLLNYERIRYESDFWIMFLLGYFPISRYNEAEGTLNEFICDRYGYNKHWIHEFKGYYDGIFNENDGYLEDPTTLELELSTGEKLYIEFHPGDTIFFIDNAEIGCIGPHYFIHKIDWPQFISYTNSLSSDQKLLLLPMLAIGDEEREDLRQIIVEGLRMIEVIKESDYEVIENSIIHNCFVKR